MFEEGKERETYMVGGGYGLTVKRGRSARCGGGGAAAVESGDAAPAAAIRFDRLAGSRVCGVGEGEATAMAAPGREACVVEGKSRRRECSAGGKLERPSRPSRGARPAGWFGSIGSRGAPRLCLYALVSCSRAVSVGH